MYGLTPWHLIIVVVIALIVFGPKRLPETGAALGRAIRDFRDAMSGESDARIAQEASPELAPPSANQTTDS